MSRIRNVALLLLVLVLATGLASAQPGIHVTQISRSGSVTQTTYDPTSGPSAKAPRAGEYWDAQTDTDYYAIPPYIYAVPNPQMAVGPDDIITIVNRSIFRFANPNALGNSLVTNPYSNTNFTSRVYLDNWLGADLATLCPTTIPQRTNQTCVIDNTTARYDQLQGRYVVLFTITDVPLHISNFVLIVSKSAQFTQGTTNTTQVFTPPIAPIVGGSNIGGLNGNWVRYIIPINVVLPGTNTAGTGFCTTPNMGGDPASAPQTGTPATSITGPIASGCSDYFPTSARIGLDNDNIILTAPVLDMSQAPFSPFVDIFNNVGAGVPTQDTEVALAKIAPPQNLPQFPGGPYAGTRVVTVPKMIVYNGATLAFGPGGGGALNLSDDTGTGTLTGINPAGSTFPNPNGTTTPANIAARYSSATNGATPWCGVLTAPVTPGSCNWIPPIFWEPDNLRGRALASFNSQIGPQGTSSAGVITPIDYLVGTLITDNLGTSQGIATPTTFLTFFVQPIIFTCPSSSLGPGPSGVTFCGNGTGAAQVADVSQLGVLNASGPIQQPRNNTASLAITSDPSLVGQAATANNGDSMAKNRLFVGDSRPQQVIFREGLLYIARAIRLYDSLASPLLSSTVSYDILRQPGPLCSSIPSGVTNFCTLAAGTNPYQANGISIPNGSLVLETYWYNGQNTPDPPPGYGFWGAMYDVPANVINQSEILSSGAPLANSSPVSPINLFPWLEKLFVAMTTGETTNVVGTFAKNVPSLWDFRPGDDAYDTSSSVLDPYTGVVIGQVANTNVCPAATSSAPCPMIPFGLRGSAQTDPNDGSLWLYGAFAKQRDVFIPGLGHWGTSVANYQLDFPTVDPYGNDNTFFSDVPASNIYFTWIQIAKNIGIAQGTTTTTNCPANAGTNPPILQPPSGGGSPSPGTSTLTCLNFGPDVTVTRSEMARWIVLSQMDENQINTYLASTGGFPGCQGLTATTPTPIGSTTGTVTCGNSTIVASSGTTTNTYNMLPANSSFGDRPANCSSTNTNCSYPGIFNDPNIRYIETLYRRGYTKGCGSTGDGIRKFCGGDFLTRAQMAIFIIRAKMNNVFPTTLSGTPICITQTCGTTYGDNFGLFLPSTAYFTDAPGMSDPTYGDYYIFIQKMRELRITNGIGGGLYGSGLNITRKEVATFVVRSFFL